MNDLPHKLNQLSRRMLNENLIVSSDLVLSASQEIVRLRATLDAKREPGPATKAMIEYCKRVKAIEGHVWERIAISIVDDFIAEWEDANG